MQTGVLPVFMRPGDQLKLKRNVSTSGKVIPAGVYVTVVEVQPGLFPEIPSTFKVRTAPSLYKKPFVVVADDLKFT